MYRTLTTSAERETTGSFVPESVIDGELLPGISFSCDKQANENQRRAARLLGDFSRHSESPLARGGSQLNLVA
jgi:hypothetical protein